MNWRDTLKGAVVTLAATILAGIVVWYFTREPNVQPAPESLRYSLESIATFDAGPRKLSFVTVKVTNAGGRAAHGVRVGIAFGGKAEIKERKIEISSGPVAQYTATSSDSGALDILLPVLAPGEVLTASLLVSGDSALDPQIGVKSDETVGTAGVAAPVKPTGASMTTLSLAAGVITAAAFIFQVMLISWLVGTGRAPDVIVTIARVLTPERDALNNAAFIYIHRGLAEDAENLLGRTITTKGGDPYLFANYGLALGLRGNKEAAQKHLDAASWWARSKHEQAIVEFSRATFLIFQDQFDEANEKLKKAFALSRREITRYCKLSVYVQNALARSAAVRKTVENRGRES